MNTPTMYQYLRCTNDNRGAAREAYVFYDAQGGIVAVESERGAWAAILRPAFCCKRRHTTGEHRTNTPATLWGGGGGHSRLPESIASNKASTARPI